MGGDDAIQELNPNEIDITKVPSQLKIEDWYSFLYEDRAQPSQCVPRTSTSRHNLSKTNNSESNTHDDDNL